MKDNRQLLNSLLWDKADARNQVLSGKLNAKEIPIPDVLETGLTDRYRSVDVADSLLHEPLAAMSAHGFRLTEDYYAGEAVHNPVYRKNFESKVEEVLILRGLIDPLLRLNTALKENYSVELEPMNGFRPLALQAAILNCFIEDAIKHLSAHYSGDELNERALNHALLYASRAPDNVTLDDPETWYTHGTGAAIDVVLTATRGGRLEFGCMFDDPSAHTNTRAFEALRSPDTETATDIAAREHRRLLFWGMAAVGFVNYPLEYFHFDPFNLGNRTTQFAIVNANSWGVDTPEDLKATIPPAREALS